MVTLADAKGYLRVDGDAEDGLIQNMVDASENYLKGAVSGYTTLYAGTAHFQVRLMLCGWRGLQKRTATATR